jgi:hypothetical protein
LVNNFSFAISFGNGRCLSLKQCYSLVAIYFSQKKPAEFLQAYISYSIAIHQFTSRQERLLRL